MKTIVEAIDISKSFGGFNAVNDVSFELYDNDITGLVGSNGAGKTTILSLLYGRLATSSGRFLLDGEDITNLPADVRVRRGLGMVFQHTTVFPDMGVRENLMLGAQRKKRGADPSDASEIDHILELTGLVNHQYDVAANLSHGEQQWLEIGMVLLCKPSVLLLDEPTSGMTKVEAARMADVCRSLIADRTVRSVVVVEHNIDFIRRVSNRVLVMHRGRIIASGTTDEVQRDQGVRDAFLGRMA